MYKLCKTEESARRQQLLEQALLTAMASRPYGEISVSDLCREAGVPRKAFYRYFSHKDGALYSLIDHTLLRFEEFATGVCRSPDRPWQESLEIYFRFWMEQRTLLEALIANDMSQIVVVRSIQCALSAQGVPQKYRRWKSLEIEEKAISFILCGVMGMVIGWCQGGFRETPEKMAATAAKLLTEPLFRVGS